MLDLLVALGRFGQFSHDTESSDLQDIVRKSNLHQISESRAIWGRDVRVQGVPARRPHAVDAAGVAAPRRGRAGSGDVGEVDVGEVAHVLVSMDG